MRDIRADLRERLEAAQATLKAAESRVQAIQNMLEAEEARYVFAPPKIYSTQASATAAAAAVAAESGAYMVVGTGGAGGGVAKTLFALANGVVQAAVTQMPLDDFLIKAVRRGVNDKEELRDAAIGAGYFVETKQKPGRVVHAKLTNLVREGSLAYENPAKGDRFVEGKH